MCLGISNEVASMYGRNNFDEFIKTQKTAGNILFEDKKRSLQQLPASGLQLPGVKAESDPIFSIPNSSPKINSKNADTAASPFGQSAATPKPPKTQAIWKNADYDQPITVTGVAGELNGVKYYNIEGSKTAIPETEIEFRGNDSYTPNPPRLDEPVKPVQPPNIENVVNTSEKSPLDIPAVKELLTDVEGSGGINVPDDIETVARMLTGKGVSRGKDFARNFDAAAGKNKVARAWLQDNVERPFLKAKDNYSKAVVDKMNGYKAKIVDELGINLKSKESAAVMWLGEGQRQVNGELMPYTLDNLKADFPDKWQNIVEADKYNRALYNELLTEINQSLESIYPNAMADALSKSDRLKENINFTEGRLIGNRKKLKTILDPAARTGLQSKIDRLEIRLKAQRTELTNLETDIASGEVLRNKRLMPRQNYYHHFQELTTGIPALGNIIKAPTDIDPRLAGISEFTKPKSKWEGFMQRRDGGAYVEDSVAAMLNYLPKAEYKAHIDPIIARNRDIISALAEATKDTRNANRFIDWMTQWTGDIAGKTNPIDRVTGEGGRQALRVVGWMNSRVKANAVMGNVRSAIAQFYNLPNAAALVLPRLPENLPTLRPAKMLTCYGLAQTILHRGAADSLNAASVGCKTRQCSRKSILTHAAQALKSVTSPLPIRQAAGSASR